MPSSSTSPSLHRFYGGTVSLGQDPSGTLDSGESHHALHVLRLKPGDEAQVFDAHGRQYHVRFTAVNHGLLTYQTISEMQAQKESPVMPVLCFALAKADKIEWVIQKSTELGIARILPFVCQRSVRLIKSPKQAQKKIERWHAITLAAVKQCGRTKIPQVDTICSFDQMLEKTRELNPRFFADETIANNLCPPRQKQPEVFSQILSSWEPKTHPSPALLIGPEGGFTKEESELCRSAGWQSVCLGRRILRCETAAIAALCVLMTKAGEI